MIRLLIAIALFFALHSPAWAQDPPAHVTWTGSVELPDDSTLDFSVELAKDSGTITIPMQHVADMKLDDVSVTDKELKFSINVAHAVWVMKVSDDGQSAVGVLTQGAELKTTMKRLAAGESAHKELVRPQEPKPPFPYDAVEVSFENQAAKVKLAGTLTLPRGEGPFPCVVMVTGSGPQDRDESLLGHRPFLVIADHLTRHGIAVLRYDDRGTAKSTGKFQQATSDDFADDALSAVGFLLTRKEIDPHKIGIVGHSEGGLIAPMCAVKSKDVAFIVMLAGTGMSGAALLPLQLKLINVAAGMKPEDAEAQAHDSAELYAMVVAGKTGPELKERVLAIVNKQIADAPGMKGKSPEELQKKAVEVTNEQMAALQSPWLKRFLALDPREALEKVKCPVLAMNGEKDLQVPPNENLTLIQAALDKGGDQEVKIVELPGLNHLFQHTKTGSPSEYGQIEETFAPEALDLMTAWIRTHTGLD